MKRRAGWRRRGTLWKMRYPEKAELSQKNSREKNRDVYNARARLKAVAKREQHNAAERARYAAKRDQIRQQHREYYAKNRQAHIARGNAARKELHKRDPGAKVARLLRCRIYDALKRQSASKHTKSALLLGCSGAELKLYLESKFLPGMTWDNYTYHGWHVDHIRPCNSFDLTDPEQQKACFRYTNLQPLWGKDNITKSDTW